MTDSFASAFSFDPFQHGAPGFKVPAVLPPGLIQSLTAPNNSMANSMRSGSGAGPSLPPWDPSVHFSPSSGSSALRSGNNNGGPSRSRQQSWAPGQTPHSMQPTSHNAVSADTSFNDFVRRNSASIAQPGYQIPQRQQQTAYHGTAQNAASSWGWGQTASGSQADPASQARPAGGGAYGQSREWQMQQLQALQAERRRYMESLPTAEASSSSSSSGGGGGGGAYASPHSSASPMGAAQTGPSLSSLGLSFPSSHDFPAASPPEGVAHGNGQQSAHQPPTIPGHIAAAWGPDGDSEMADQTQQASGSRSSSKTGRRTGDAASAPGPDSTADSALTRSDSSSNLYRPWPKAPSPSKTSESYPPLKLNLSRVDRKGVAPHVVEAFFGRDEAEERKLFQPHLVDLKERRKEERAKKAELLEEKKKKASQKRGGDAEDDAEAGGKKASSSPDPAAGGGEKGKKAPHVLLTEAEKKANHIASEQKRRANIRKGYEMLCAGVPALREALEKEGSGGAGGTGDNGTADADASYDVGGERIDGRAGPRSEAVVLGKSVEHLRQLLEEHRDLCSRRDHARAKLARNKLGVDVVVANGDEDDDDVAGAEAASSTTGTTKKGKAGGAAKGKAGKAANSTVDGATAPSSKKAAAAAAGGNKKAASKANKAAEDTTKVKEEQSVDGMQED